ncbi:MAG: hypothetical protein ACRDGJ_02045 [Candidatus Limnocylindria bacterium]
MASAAAVAILLAAVALPADSLGAPPAIVPLSAPQALKTSGEPFGIAIDPQGGRAYVTDSRENTLSVFDLTSGDVLAYIPTGRQPNHVVLFGGRAFVSNFTDASITVIDTSANRAVKTLSVGGLGLAINPETKRLYAAGGSRVSVLDAVTGALVADLGAPPGANVWGVAVDPATNRIYATDIANARLLVYDGATNALVGEVEIDAPARFGIAVGPSGRVSVASYTDRNAQLSVIDGLAAKVVARVPAGPFTTSLVANPAGLVYASSSADRTITAVDPFVRASLSKVSLPQTPGGLAIHPSTGELLVVTPGGAAPPVRVLVDPVPVIKP